MPLTPFQETLLRTLAQNRSPDSFLIGGTVLNQGIDTPRYSRDLDISHDQADAVAVCAELDEKTLIEHDYSVDWQLRQPSFQRATVTKNDETTQIEWLYDSAFRFFPVQEDSITGYRLHPFDAATNKLLAMVNRSEPRDLLDILYLNNQQYSLGTLAWAAAGKDEGLTPKLILEMADRHAIFREEEYSALETTTSIDITDLRMQWIKAINQAGSLISQLPAKDLGCAWLDKHGNPRNANPGNEELRPHRGSLGGAWPEVR